MLPTQGVEDSLAVAGDEEVVSYHEEDMAALLPRSLLHSESTECPSTRSVSRNDTILSQLGFSNETDESSTPSQGPHHLGPWGKKLPSNDQFDSSQPPADPRFRVASAGGYFDQRPRRLTKAAVGNSNGVLPKSPAALSTGNAIDAGN